MRRIGCSQGGGEDGQSRITGTVLRKRGSAHHPEVRDLPVLQIRIHHAGLGGFAHDGAAVHMRALIRLIVVAVLTGVSNLTHAHVHGLGDFLVKTGEHRTLGAFMIGPVQREANQRIAVLIGVSGVEIDKVLAVRTGARLRC